MSNKPKFTQQELDFFKLVVASPGAKLSSDCFASSETDEPYALWQNLEAAGLIKCVGSYRWEPAVDVLALGIQAAIGGPAHDFQAQYVNARHVALELSGVISEYMRMPCYSLQRRMFQTLDRYQTRLDDLRNDHFEDLVKPRPDPVVVQIREAMERKAARGEIANLMIGNVHLMVTYRGIKWVHSQVVDHNRIELAIEEFDEILAKELAPC